MPRALPKTSRQAAKSAPKTADDPVLQHLRQASTEYRKLRAKHVRAATELTELTDRLATTEASVAQLEAELAELRHKNTIEHKRLQSERQHVSQLATMLEEIHRALFSGNVYEQILRSCLTLSQATRGLYITAHSGTSQLLKVRAAIDVDGYPQAPVSPWINILCEQVFDGNDVFVWKTGEDVSHIGTPTKPGEAFRNCMVVPVVLMKNFDGIIIVADKVTGNFSKTDAETLLTVGGQARVAIENQQLHRELQSTYVSTITMLADAVEAKDSYTHGHCELVSRYARLTAERLKLSSEDCSIICYAGLLHDVGKIGVSDGILHKPGPLLPEERELIRSHVRVGYDLIRNIPALERIANIVLHHHEWYDGTGYPIGVQGEAIPIAARIVTVVDSYCAMISKRSYKEAFDDALARAELTRCAGTQFDPIVVQAFLEAIDLPEASLPVGSDEVECGLLPDRHNLLTR